MDFGLDDKTALVTGGAGRIGSEDCYTLAEEGAEVVVLDVNKDGAKDVADEIEEDGGDAIALECDLTDREAVSEAVEDLQDATGGVDILVNNAGMVDAVGTVGDLDPDIWDRDMTINLTGTYNITREIFPNMCDRGFGRIITMSSLAGWEGGYGQISYSTTKAGLIGFGKTLALEGAPEGVTSNILAPTIVVGDLAELPHDQLENVNEHWADIARATPMDKLGKEEDVANLVAYLSSEQAEYITGQVLGVTGGVDLFTY
ncbi:SDR family NAD(P)-dependent oxidoreductase [Halorientalis litorea]|jgi:NAD(P)-dependent dehydrogenase (short-subunit alcohol dehydrogenase family)|uniref:SDR family NAD(P)-dependent oxidoreductase n=1 Tax=Halorientalis litorea TaxID=2931977 RepID=UPI001FF6C075|nr:SDR family NAD(P)-dependent oxidoreductase [Halorientalis litorea]